MMMLPVHSADLQTISHATSPLHRHRQRHKAFPFRQSYPDRLICASRNSAYYSGHVKPLYDDDDDDDDDDDGER